MSQTVEKILANATLYTDGQNYKFVQLPPKAITAAAGVVADIGEAFCALIADKDDVTLMMPSEAFDDFARRLPGCQSSETLYRLITIDVALEPTLVGFMARISEVLADAGISIMPYAGYTRDHVFVPAEKFELAMSTLEELKSEN